jgi:hypothetical protein
MGGKNIGADPYPVACACKPAAHEQEYRRPVVVGHFISISKVKTPAFQAGRFHPGCLRDIGISDVGHR